MPFYRVCDGMSTELYENQIREAGTIIVEHYSDHQTLGGFPKVKEGSSRGFDGK